MSETNETPAPQETSPAESETPASAETTAWTAPQALAEWRRLNDERDAAQAAYEEQIQPMKAALEAQVAPMVEKLEALEAWFLDHAEQVGQEVFESDAGKVTIATRETPKITDADSFFAWAAASNNMSMLQKRISVTSYREYIKANPDQEPPGVTVEQDRSAKFKA